MKWSAVLTMLLAAFIAVTSGHAQTGAPIPAPELKNLAVLVGDWTAEGTLGQPGMPPGHFVYTTHAEWLEGSFFLVERTDMDLGPMGKGQELAVMGYDPDKKAYTYKSYNSWGRTDDSLGSLSGDTLTWISDENMGGQPVKGRFTMKILSPTAYTVKFEFSPDGKNWTTALDGKATKK
jgi:hypothetical protein